MCGVTQRVVVDVFDDMQPALSRSPSGQDMHCMKFKPPAAAAAACLSGCRGGKLAALQLAGNPVVHAGYLIDPGERKGSIQSEFNYLALNG
jgi:hypothetical protein